MNAEQTPASEQDLEAVQLAAKKRRLEILVDADALQALADFYRESMDHRGAATVMARCARTLRELVS